MSQRRLPIGHAVEESPDMEDRIPSKAGHPEPSQPLSDSENEEPFPGKAPYRSAFVSKNNAGCFTSLAWSIQSKVERSQSCSDPVNEALPPGRRKAPQLPKPKVPCTIGSSACITGILLSTENSRSFSAPVLTSEKRVVISALNSFTPLHKPERSISPESNDSISEELNHFKPIVCSPCTPPKRLPDGRVLSPVIVKSTPRNLRRNLQKPTSYEASPVILKKWEQVFRDRQMKRTLSKGTLTASCEEGGSSAKKPATEPTTNPTTLSGVAPAADVELPPSCSREEALLASFKDQPPNPCINCAQSTGQTPEPVTVKNLVEVSAAAHMRRTRLATRPTSNKKTISQCKCLVTKPSKASLRRKSSQSSGLPNGSCDELGLTFPPRRGQKRRCKSKHLEPNGGLKRLRVTRRGGQGGFERLWREAEKRLHQEEEDKKLAMKLQQIFDKESRMVNRHKGSRDAYPLRSKSMAGAN
ncbi:E3 ubiquitin-protein ligase RNF169 [Gastrophryne carolinensis]